MELRPMANPTIALHGAAEVFDLKAERFVAVRSGEALTVTSPIRTQRTPESVRVQLNDHGQFRMTDTAGIEIRFVSDGPVTLTLSANHDWPARALSLFHGDMKMSNLPVALSTEPTTVTLKRAERLQRVLDRLEEGGESAAYARRLNWTFSPYVTRLRLPWEGGPITIHNVEVEAGVSCRAPHADELPRKCMISYGTSITHGAIASQPELTYPALTAYHLGVDHINLGSGGSAHCENAMADYIAGRDDWDFATLALSVNMQAFEQAEYRSRLSYMVKTVAAAHPTKPVFAITLWPYFRDLGVADGGTSPGDIKSPAEEEQKALRMRQDLRDVVHAAGQANLHLLEGPELFGPMSGLATDLIHPSDLGMIAMAHNLAAAIRPYVS